jgi:anaerobic magnesium-protoporphyrin IX monomethyl ester cyclase
MISKQKVLLFNPRSANFKYRLPNSLLAVAAAIDNNYEWVIVDGNRENDPEQKIINYLNTGEFAFFGLTVMPGPQLKQAIPISKKAKALFPNLTIIWGGYFASNQPETVLHSGFVDFIINGMGDKAFPELLNLISNEGNHFYEKLPLTQIPHNLIYEHNRELVFTAKDGIYNPDELPDFPYHKLHQQYDIPKYLGNTYLGNKTIAYHSSFGCPFTCSFCAVVPIYNARWKGKSAANIYREIKYLKDNFGGDSIEFHDNNFFVSEKRTVEFSELIMNDNMVWWGEGRIDTIDKYSDASLEKMRKSGCKMIFFGAETGNDEMLKQMDKGGTQSAAQIKKFAARMAKFDIIPEYSFVLGTPADTPEKVMDQIDKDIAFIREIKEINPATEIIIYVYSPVPTKGSELYEKVLATGFRFPEKLEDWINADWENFDLRKNPLTPWLTPAMVDKIKNFETVLNGYFPTATDIKISPFQKNIIRYTSALRYHSKIYHYPYEIKALQKFWLRYRQPEIQGF